MAIRIEACIGEDMLRAGEAELLKGSHLLVLFTWPRPLCMVKWGRLRTEKIKTLRNFSLVFVCVRSIELALDPQGDGWGIRSPSMMGL